MMNINDINDNRDFEFNVTRIAMYKWLWKMNVDFLDSKREYIKIFIDLLDGVEDDIIKNKDYVLSDELNKRIKMNITSNEQKIIDIINNESVNKRSKNKLINDFKLLVAIAETNNKRLFMKLTKFITNISDRLFKKNLYINYVKNFESNIELKNINRVFLSYAFKDRLYLLGIFMYFYSKGILLYIDAFHNEEQTEGKVLKSLLAKELDNCGQLLFLRTANSELSIRGAYQIRQWCAWEIGYYNKKHSDEEGNCFYFRVYEKELDTNKPVNLLIHSFRKLSRIDNGLLK